MILKGTIYVGYDLFKLGALTYVSQASRMIPDEVAEILQQQQLCTKR